MQSFGKVKNLKEIEIILENMATKFSIDKLQKQEKGLSKQLKRPGVRQQRLQNVKKENRLKRKPRNKRRGMKNHVRCVEKSQKMTKISQNQGQPM